MAIQTDYRDHHGGSSSIWSCSELALDNKDSQVMNISQSLLEGSISLGRYEHEVLAWEKYSAFTHNRLQEEIEKFKEPGLVAQKKAYFEKHYRKTKSSKSLDETTPRKGETCQILHTDDHNNLQRTESVNRLEQEPDRAEQEPETYCERDSRFVKQSVERDSPLSPSIRRCSDTSLRVRVSRIECRLKKLSPVSKPKWSISSPKSKSSVTPKAAKNTTSNQFSSLRQQKEVQDTSTSTCDSLIKNKIISLSSSSATTSSVLTQSSQTNSKEITNTIHLRKLSVDKRTCGVGVVKKFQELSNHHRRSNSGESKSPRPKSMTIKPLSETKSKQAIVPEVAERVNSPRLSKQKKMGLSWR